MYTWFPSKAAIVAALATRLRGASAARLDVHLWSGALTDHALRDAAQASFEQSIAGIAEILGDGDDTIVALGELLEILSSAHP